MKKILTTFILIAVLAFGIFNASGTALAAGNDFYCMQRNAADTSTMLSFLPAGGTMGLFGVSGTFVSPGGYVCTKYVLGSRFTLSGTTINMDLTAQPESNITNLVSDLSTLTSAVAAKFTLPGSGTTSQFIDGTGALQTSKTLLSQFTNDAGFITSAPAATWGSITGTLSSQTDLATALAGKANTATTLAGYGITDAYPLTGNPSGFLTSNAVSSVAGRTGAVTLSNTDISGLGTAATSASTDFATSAQGAKADTALQNITGKLTSGTNTTISGSGTTASPYSISATIPSSAYQSYQTIASQSGTSAPTGSSLYNDFGGTTFAWARTGTGTYTLTASSAVFTSGKTAIILSSSTSPINNITATRTSSTVVTFTTSQLNLLALGVGNVDSLMSNTLVEVRVYP